jgi:hypothetical protein
MTTNDKVSGEDKKVNVTSSCTGIRERHTGIITEPVLLMLPTPIPRLTPITLLVPTPLPFAGAIPTPLLLPIPASIPLLSI